MFSIQQQIHFSFTSKFTYIRIYILYLEFGVHIFVVSGYSWLAAWVALSISYFTVPGIPQYQEYLEYYCKLANKKGRETKGVDAKDNGISL